MHTVTVYLPRLADYISRFSPEELPGLALLLNRGRVQAIPASENGHLLEILFKDQRVPAAFYWCYGQLADEPKWLARLIPIHVAPTQNQLRVSNPENIQIPVGGLNTLVPQLNEVLTGTAIRAVLGMRDQLFLVADEDQAIQTSSLWELAGADLLQHLPRGENDKLWRRIFNDLQMETSHLLGALTDPYNESRPNALWISDAGCWPQSVESGWDVVVGDNPLLAAFAQLSGAKHEENVEQWLSQPQESLSRVLLLPQIDINSNGSSDENGDLDLEKSCLLPLITKIKAGQLQRLIIRTNSHVIDFSKTGFWQFWRSTKRWPAWM